MKLGDGLADGVKMGPLANARRLDAMEGIVNDCKSRGGKTVTLITGLDGTPSALAALASDLKRLCGTGGTLRG